MTWFVPFLFNLNLNQRGDYIEKWWQNISNIVGANMLGSTAKGSTRVKTRDSKKITSWNVSISISQKRRTENVNKPLELAFPLISANWQARPAGRSKGTKRARPACLLRIPYVPSARSPLIGRPWTLTGAGAGGLSAPRAKGALTQIATVKFLCVRTGKTRMETH